MAKETIRTSDARPPSMEETMAAASAPAIETSSVDDTMIASPSRGLETSSVDDTMIAGSATGSGSNASLDETLSPDPRAVSVVDDTMIEDSAAAPPSPKKRRRAKGAEAPAAIDRYVVLGRLGAGAMGEVLAAYDPRLDRKVALKRIHPGGASLDAARIRLEREAQALAKLDHRNVVSVHDVIVHNGSVFVAMEFVEGETLGDWMRDEHDRPRPWREVIPVFEAVGAGLAAVHAVGLIHRDVKPGNVMIGTDGRVRVMDFGLARVDDDAEDSAEISAVYEIPEELGDLRDSILGSQAKTQELTQAGAMLGTPAYMAPEQFAGMRATARSDQFSFCIALYEALYGSRPFSGESVLELCAAVIEGKMDEPPRDVEVPNWLRAVVMRGLAHESSDRFASMDELLAALGTYEQRRRRRRFIGAGLGLAFAGLAVLAAQRWDLAKREQACVAAGEVVDVIWDSEARRAIEAGIVATQLSYAQTSAARVLPWLDAYADSWREQAQTACAASTVERSWDLDTHDRAAWCLEQRRSAMASLIDRLARAEALDVQYAVESAAALQDPSTCTNTDALADMGPAPEPAMRPQVLALQDRLLLAERFDRGEGSDDAAIEIAKSVERDARALPWLPLAIRARRLEGRMLRLRGETDEAESHAAAAYGEAARAGLWTEATSAATLAGSIVGKQELRGAEARLWLESAEIARAHANDPHGLLDSEIEAARASLERAAKQFEQAVEHGEQARAGIERVFGPEHPRVSDALLALATIHTSKGDYDRALALQTQALELARQSLGPDHPQVGRSLSGLGKIHATQGEREAAAADFEQALAIFEVDELSRPQLISTLNLLGTMRYEQGHYEQARELLTRATKLVESTPNIPRRLEADTINNLGIAYRGLEDYAKARELYERALAIFIEILGPYDEAVAASHNNIAILLYFDGDIKGAAERLELSVEIDERTLGPNHPDLVAKLTNLGRTRARLGEHDRALAYLRRALAINELALGRDRADHGPLLRYMGKFSLETGDYPAGLAAYARGLALLETDEAGWTKELARMRLAYGRALWDAPAQAGRDRARARALVEQAREGFAGLDAKQDLSDCDLWLAEHR